MNATITRNSFKNKKGVIKIDFKPAKTPDTTSGAAKNKHVIFKKLSQKKIKQNNHTKYNAIPAKNLKIVFLYITHQKFYNQD